MEVVKELPLDKHRLCLTQDGRQVCLELWLKTRRRKCPWDRLIVGSMEDGAGLRVNDSVNYRAEPFLERVRGLLPEFDPIAVVLSVSSR